MSHENLMEVAENLANKIIVNAPLAIKAIMYTVRHGLESPLPYVLCHAEITNDVIVVSSDAKEGLMLLLRNGSQNIADIEKKI